MKWKLFGYGVVLCAVLIFSYKAYFKKKFIKPETKIEETGSIPIMLPEEEEVKFQEVFYPLKYGSLPGQYLTKYKNKIMEVQNGVLFSGSEEEFTQFQKIIERIDVPPIEYIIDVLLLSVDVTTSEQTGLSLLFETLSNSQENFSLILDGFGNFIYQGNLGQIVASLSNTKSKIKIEGHSQISVMLGSVANITSGERRAVINNTVSEGISVNSSYKFVDIGLKLNVELLNGSNNNVAKLKVRQESENVTGFSRIDNNDIPVISQQLLETSCLVDVGEVVFLGGLTQKNIKTIKNNFPILSWIPFLGKYFSKTSNDESQTDLIIILQPIIPREQRGNFIKRKYINSLMGENVAF